MNMKNEKEVNKAKTLFFKNYKFTGLLIFVIWSLILFKINLYQKRVKLKNGEIATYEIIADRDIEFIDKEATEARVKEIKKSVPLIFSRKKNIKNKILKEIKLLLRNPDKYTPAKRYFTENEKKYIRANKKILENKLHYIFNYIYSKGVCGISKTTITNLSSTRKILIYEKEKNRYITKNLNEIFYKNSLNLKNVIRWLYGNLDKKEATILIKISKLFIKPDLLYEKKLTESRRKEVSLTVAPVKRIIKKGETIVHAGEEITENQYKILSRIEREKFAYNIKNTTGYFFLLLIFYLTMFYFIKLSAPEWIEKKKNFYFLLTSLIVYETIFFLSYKLTENFEITGFKSFYIPITSASIHFNYFIPTNLPPAIMLFLIVILSAFVKLKTIDFIILIIMNLLIFLFTHYIKKRRNFWKFIPAILGGYVILSTILGFAFNWQTSQFLNNFLIVFINSITSVITSIIFIIIFETIFNYPTEYRLIELSDLNLPVMKELLLKAPGTYQHSLLTATLAENAAKEIGANALLVRVSAYYHDIGKLKKPEFFTENWQGRRRVDKHKRLKPEISAAIVKAHVMDSVEMAKRLKIPEEVIEIIKQHHGDSFILFFYKKALHQYQKNHVNPDDYRYDGPKPQTKEAAILMLADSIEAASRSIKDITRAKVVKLVNSIITSKMKENQLSESPLTLKDINTLKEVFVNTLVAIYHSRITYPK